MTVTEAAFRERKLSISPETQPRHFSTVPKFHPSKIPSLSSHHRLNQPHQIHIFFHRFELRELTLHNVRRAEKKSDMRFCEHGSVIKGISRRDDVIIQQLERRHCPLFLFRNPQLII